MCESESYGSPRNVEASTYVNANWALLSATVKRTFRSRNLTSLSTIADAILFPLNGEG
jgi:hypothetical protein